MMSICGSIPRADVVSPFGCEVHWDSFLAISVETKRLICRNRPKPTFLNTLHMVGRNVHVETSPAGATDFAPRV